MAESALSVAGSRAGANDVHRRDLPVGGAADPRRQTETVDRDYMQFGYDTSTLHKQRDIALAVTFQLEPGDKAVMHRIMQENLSWSGGKHPWLEYHPSAGSIFKKIEGVGAGRLIDQVGLKGFRHGDAQISHIHANIMVNLGKATAQRMSVS